MDRERLSKVFTERQFREIRAEIRKTTEDADDRRVDLSFSSDQPVERWWGVEILSHDPSAVGLDRINDGAPLLVGHDTNAQVGVVERAWLEGGKARATVRFSRVGQGPDVLTDVNDGIRTKVSVGYMIHDLEEIGEQDGLPVYRITRWEPYEVSLVSVPADSSVGVGRSANVQTPVTLNKPQGGDTMTPEEIAVQLKEARDAGRLEGGDSENARLKEIEAYGVRFRTVLPGIDEMLTSARANKSVTLETFKGQVADKMLAAGRPVGTPAAEIGLTDREAQEYSIVRAIRHILDPKTPAGFEMEVQAEMIRRGLQTRGGIVVPWEVQKQKMMDDPGYRSFMGRDRRDLLTTSAGSAGNLVGTNLLAGDFIEMLRASALTLSVLGTRMMTGLTGSYNLPRQTSAGTAVWTAEGTGITSESTQVFDLVPLAPKEVGAYTDVSRKMILEGTPSIEGLVRSDLASVLGLGIDAAIFEGAGSATVPRGVKNVVGVGAVSGAGFAWPGAVELESDVAAANALAGVLAYVTTPAVAGSLKTREKSTGYPVFLIGEDNRMNGYPVYRTTNITAAHIFFGNWAENILGMWGGLEILVNPYRQDIEGLVRITAWQTVDVATRHAGSFSVVPDFT